MLEDAVLIFVFPKLRGSNQLINEGHLRHN